jgi:hypothetical protein
MNPKNPQNPFIRIIRDAEKKGRLRWCFSPTKYKSIDLLVKNINKGENFFMPFAYAPDGRDSPKARVWRISAIRNSRTAGNGANKKKIILANCLRNLIKQQGITFLYLRPEKQAYAENWSD